MNILKRKILIFVLALSFVLSLGIGLVGVRGVNAQTASTPRAVTELFMPSNMTFDTAYLDEEGESSELGLLLSATNRLDSIQLKGDYSGDLSLLTAPVIKEGMPVVQKFMINISDVDTGESFNIVIKYGTSIYIYVNYDKINVGLSYSANSLRGTTTLANAKDIYTLCSSSLNTVVFKPEEMGVYLGEGEEELLVWSFLEEEMDGRNVGFTLPKFEKYNVTLSVPEYVGESAGMVFYSINGKLLNRIVLNGETQPEFYADFKKKALTGYEYTLPKAYAFDLWEGQLSNVSCAVKDPLGNEVTLIKNNFTPEIAGQYSVTYSATTKLGVKNSKEYVLDCCDVQPDFAQELDGNIPETVKVGKTVYVPKLVLSDGLLYWGTEVAAVSIYRNNLPVLSKSNVKSGFDYRIIDSGVYRFDYAVGIETISFEMVADNTAEPIEFSYEFKSIYEQNDFINLSNEILFIDGQVSEFAVRVTFPDGKAYKNEQFLLSQTGLYTVEISSVGSDERTLEYSFDVYDKVSGLFSSLSDGVTIEYGTNLFSGNDGVKVTMKSNATEIKYNQPIDISKYVDQTKPNNSGDLVQGEDKIYIKETATPFISFSMEPRSYGTQPMRFVTVILTDAEDPTNQVSILLDSSNEAAWTYLKAKAGTQGYAGWNAKTTAPYSSGSLLTELNGAITHHSFKGQPPSAYNAKDSKVELYYDNEQKQILAYQGYDIKHNGNISCIVADFDNPNLSNGESWGGFKSNNVYLSILFGSITNEASCVIHGIDGRWFTTEHRTFSKPTIKVDMPKDNGVSVSQLLGLKGRQISVPEAVAFDTDGQIITNLVAQAYFVSGVTNYNVNIIDGKFDTPFDGTYLIKYYARDKYGNIGEETVSVFVYQSYTDLQVGVVPVDDEFTIGKTGAKIRLFDKNNLDVDNALGGTTAKVQVLFGTQNVVVTNDMFIPDYAGVYTVIYTITDSVGREVIAQYEVDIELDTEPVVSSSVPVYYGFIEGNTYDLPPVYVIDYASGDITPKKVSIYIDDEEYYDDTITPDVSAVEELNDSEVIRYFKIEYKYGGKVVKAQNDDGTFTELSYSVPVRNVFKKHERYPEGSSRPIRSTMFRTDRYFIVDQAITEYYTTTSLSWALESTQTKGLVKFSNPIYADNLSLTFSVQMLETGINVKTISIYLTLQSDRNKVVKLSFVKDGENTLMFFGDSKTREPFNGSLTDAENNQFSIKFNNMDGSVSDVVRGSIIDYVKYYEDGSVFNGFEGKVLLSIEIEKEHSVNPAKVSIGDISGQTFISGKSNDDGSPMLTVNGMLESNYDINSEVVIPSANATDILSGIDYDTLKVSVLYTDADGNQSVVKDLNGKLLDEVSALTTYTIKVKSIGEYSVSYSVKDLRGTNGLGEVFIFNGVSYQKPKITLKSKLPTQVKVGSTVKIPSYSVKFVVKNEENTHYVIYRAPDDRHQYILSDSFVASEVGEYVVRFFALDIYGNYTLLEYTINVVE